MPSHHSWALSQTHQGLESHKYVTASSRFKGNITKKVIMECLAKIYFVVILRNLNIFYRII